MQSYAPSLALVAHLVVFNGLNDSSKCFDVTVDSQSGDRDDDLIVSRLVTTPDVVLIVVADVKLAHHLLPQLAASLGLPRAVFHESTAARSGPFPRRRDCKEQ